MPTFKVVEDKAKVLEMEAIFEKFERHTDLVVYGYMIGAIWNMIKIFWWVDVLIGTPNKLGEMFTTAGFNVNRLKMFIIDDADSILKLRHETKLMRMSNSINKTLLSSERLTGRIESLVDKMMVEPSI
jgi:superfamily II DNA/RNA helicase